MKKIVLFLALACALRAVADDSYLYWMVDTTVLGDVSWDSAKISYSSAGDSSGYLMIYGDLGTSYIGESVSYGTVVSAQEVGAGLWAKLMASPSASYVIELWKDNVAVGTSQPYASSDLAEHIAKTGISAPSLGMLMAPIAPAPVPEPTSGLLILLGCAGLALRRRRPARA